MFTHLSTGVLGERKDSEVKLLAHRPIAKVRQETGTHVCSLNEAADCRRQELVGIRLVENTYRAQTALAHDAPRTDNAAAFTNPVETPSVGLECAPASCTRARWQSAGRRDAP